MPIPDTYRTIRADQPAVRSARETKTKLGLTWTEFLEQAAATLDD